MQRSLELLLENEHFPHRKIAFVVGPRQAGKRRWPGHYSPGEDRRISTGTGTTRPGVVNSCTWISSMFSDRRCRARSRLPFWTKYTRIRGGRPLLRVFGTPVPKESICWLPEAGDWMFTKGEGRATRALSSIPPASAFPQGNPGSRRQRCGRASAEDYGHHPGNRGSCPGHHKKNTPRASLLGRFSGTFPGSKRTKASSLAARRRNLIIKEDLRDLSCIRLLSQVEELVELRRRAGGVLSYHALRVDLQVAVESVRQWIDQLQRLYFIYLIRPFAGKLPRALRKRTENPDPCDSVGNRGGRPTL